MAEIELVRRLEAALGDSMYPAPSLVRLRLAGRTVELGPFSPSVLIGRDTATCGLACDDLDVSRRHAEVFIIADQPRIRDLGSSNGTWVDGTPVGSEPVVLRPGQQVYVGYQPLEVEWLDTTQGATIVAEMPSELRARIAQRKASLAAGPGPAPPPPAQAAHLMDGGAVGPTPQSLTYRRQGKNGNGVLLIALPGDTFTNTGLIEGFVEFTALDEENISSILVELVEYHPKGGKKGHVWDRVLVRQGPWRSRKGDVLPMPFQLRVPPGTSASGEGVRWEVRGLVDIDWAFDVNANSPITMRNVDVERIRDALGSLDYRIDTLSSEALGQRYTGTFQPPAQRQAQVGISSIQLGIDYLGANLRIELLVKKTKLFKFDRRTDLVFDLESFRGVPLSELARRFEDEIEALMLT